MKSKLSSIAHHSPFVLFTPLFNNSADDRTPNSNASTAMLPPNTRNESQRDNQHQDPEQRYSSNEQLSNVVSTRSDIPTSAVPAFLDELPDLSRYPRLQDVLVSQDSAAVKQRDFDVDSPFQTRVLESMRFAQENPCPQPSSGSILELKKYRKAPIQKIQRDKSSSSGPDNDVAPSRSNAAPALPRPRANSDLKGIYTTQQQKHKTLTRSNSKLISAFRRPTPSPKPVTSPSPAPSTESDRASLPSQKSKCSTDSTFYEGRRLSRSGALRRKKTGDSNLAPESQFEPVEANTMAHGIPAPPSGMVDRLQDTSRPSSNISEGSLRRPDNKNCITVDVGSTLTKQRRMGGDFSEFRLPEGLEEAPVPAWAVIDESVVAESDTEPVAASDMEREKKKSVWKRMGEKVKNLFRK